MPDRNEVLTWMMGYVLAFLFLVAVGYIASRPALLLFYLLYPMATTG